MKKLKKILSEKKNLIFPFILSFVLSYTLLSAYSISFFSVWTLLAAAVCAITIEFCVLIKKLFDKGGIYRFISRPIIFLICIAIMSIFSVISLGRDYGAGFYLWFTEGTKSIDTQTHFIAALLITLPVFFSFVVYYFTRVFYRISFITLVSFVPCMLYIKVADDISIINIALISILDVILFMIHRYEVLAAEMKITNIRGALISASAFAALLLAAASVIPKNDNAVYAGRLERFLNIDLQNTLMENYSNLSMFSGNADSLKDMPERMLYTIEFDEPKNSDIQSISDTEQDNIMPYMKRQIFDYYDFKNNHWYADDYYSDTYSSISEWNASHKQLSLSALMSAIKKAGEYSAGFAEKYNRLFNADMPQDDIKTIKIYSNDFSAKFYIAPVRCVNITGNADISPTRHGTFLTKWYPHSPNTLYKINFFDDISIFRSWTECGGADFDIDLSDTFLQELSDILQYDKENNAELIDTAEAFRTQQRLAKGYNFICEGNTSLIPQRIQSLAAMITAGCSYDYEKASAIQNYFTEQEFIYDLDYKAEDDSAEYFLFESRRGTCSDFASAYTLLARSAGLTVRYAEGFVPRPRYNKYTISSTDSHAYPEVYIPNTGWIVYEPTVPASASAADTAKIGLLDLLHIDIELLAVIVSSILAAAGILIFILFILPYISEHIFFIKASSAEPSEGIAMIYKRIASKTLTGLLGNTSALTPFELACKLKNTLGYDMYSLAFCAEEVLYGNKRCDEEELKQALYDYRHIRTLKKNFKKISDKNYCKQ